MSKRSILTIVISTLLLASLAIWQVNLLKNSILLRNETQKTQIHSLLMEAAIEIRQTGSKQEIYDEYEKLEEIAKGIIHNKFQTSGISGSWGVFNGLDEKLYGPVKEDSLCTEYIACLSCLVMIHILEDDMSHIDNKGFMLNHDPAQMMEVRGLDAEKLDYLKFYPEIQSLDLSQFILPVLFILGLAVLLLYLIGLSTKQRQLIQQKNEFVNHLSHQFQTPLSSIKLSANILINNEVDNPSELVQIIQTESNRLENHIKTVLHWVKSDADRLHVNKTLVSLTDLIEKAFKQMKPVFLSNKTQAIFLPPVEEIYIMADPSHLQLMLFNIWENAIKHNSESVELITKCNITEQYHQIIIQDNGKGMSGPISPKKWKGLGLAYVHKMMEEHQGNLKISSPKNSGLEITLNFPKHA